MEGMGSRGGDWRKSREDRMRRVFRGRRWRGWVVEEEIGGRGEKIGGGECLGEEMEGMGSRGGDGRRWR